jgi:hypothetical protein
LTGLNAQSGATTHEAIAESEDGNLPKIQELLHLIAHARRGIQPSVRPWAGRSGLSGGGFQTAVISRPVRDLRSKMGSFRDFYRFGSPERCDAPGKAAVRAGAFIELPKIAARESRLAESNLSTITGGAARRGAAA